MKLDCIFAELDAMAQREEKLAARLKPGSEGWQVATHRAAAAREAIVLLRTHQDNQPNEPLTLEDLRGMVGEWVWVTEHYNNCDCSGWIFICTDTKIAGLDQMLSIEDCGTKFDAYRRPPKEETP